VQSQDWLAQTGSLQQMARELGIGETQASKLGDSGNR
jgi:hypothetical protein